MGTFRSFLSFGEASNGRRTVTSYQLNFADYQHDRRPKWVSHGFPKEIWRQFVVVGNEKCHRRLNANSVKIILTYIYEGSLGFIHIVVSVMWALTEEAPHMYATLSRLYFMSSELISSPTEPYFAALETQIVSD